MDDASVFGSAAVVETVDGSITEKIINLIVIMFCVIYWVAAFSAFVIISGSMLVDGNPPKNQSSYLNICSFLAS